MILFFTIFICSPVGKSRIAFNCALGRWHWDANVTIRSELCPLNVGI